MARRKQRSKVLSSLITAIVVLLLLCVILYALGIGHEFFDPILEKIGITGSTGGDNNDPDTDPDNGGAVVTDGDVQIHFLELGNKYTGDCTYIKVGETDILIDAGSKKGSIPTIDAYLKQYVTDNTLEYVIVTHAHQDHIAGFCQKDGSLFDLYECQNIITFSRTDTTSKIYNEDFIRELEDEKRNGAVHKTAKELRESGDYIIDLGNSITLTILDNKFYYEKAKDENDYSVCCLLEQGENKYLFTGDLEAEGEESLVELNELPAVTLFKGGHHGSFSSSSEALLNVIKPEIVCVCCCAGTDEYTDNPANQFPAQDFCDRVAKYTDRVYVTSMTDGNDGFTSMNGNITVTGNATGVTVSCSASELVLKDSEWFKTHRTCPPEWKDD